MFMCVRVCVCCVRGCGWSVTSISVSLQIDYQTDSIPAFLSLEFKKNIYKKLNSKFRLFCKVGAHSVGNIKSESVIIMYFQGKDTHTFVHLYMHGHTDRHANGLLSP